MRSRSLIASAALTAALTAALFVPAAHAEIPDELLTSPLAETFGSAPAINRPRLSPDGSKMLFLGQAPESFGLAFVLDIESGDLKTIAVGTEDAYDIGWCEWANEERVLCDLNYAISADGEEVTQLVSGRQRRPPERVGACGLPAAVRAVAITLDRLPDDPEHVSRTCGRTSMANIYSGLIEPVSEGSGIDQRGSLMSNGHNFTPLQLYRTPSSYDEWYFRSEVGGDWTLLDSSYPLDFEDPFRPIGFGENTDVLFQFAESEGRWGLFGIDLGSEDRRSQHLFTHPDFDLELADTLGPYGRVVAVAYLDGRPQRYIVDARVARVYQAALELFPEHNVEVVDESWDGSRYIVLAREPKRAGSFYLLDMNEGTVEPLGAQYPQLADVELAETRTVSFTTADGGTVSGHLTLPNGNSTPGAAVIIPRGLPSRLDVADPHYLVQYLAASGYAVLRVHSRGSEEHGPWLPERSVLTYRQGASDINDAIDYLVAEGIAESDRVCGAGMTIGAYTALTNAVEHPGRLACLVSIAAMADSRAFPGSQVMTTLAGDYIDLLRDSNPIRRAREIEAPTLLFHGQYDGIVPLGPHTLGLNQALDRRDNEVTYIEYEHARHDIERAPYRIDMLTRIGSFLASHIGSGS